MLGSVMCSGAWSSPVDSGAVRRGNVWVVSLSYIKMRLTFLKGL